MCLDGGWAEAGAAVQTKFNIKEKKVKKEPWPPRGWPTHPTRRSGSAEVIIHSTQLRAVRGRVAATVSLHQLRPLVAALIAGRARFKTMIYLIKPHFCIVSRAFVVARPTIIPGAPITPVGTK